MLPENKQYFFRLLMALKKLKREGYSPIDIVTNILHQWMLLVTPSVALQHQSERPSVSEAEIKFSNWLADMDILTGAFWLSTTYAELIEHEQRKSSAMFFTPPYLSSRMLDNAGELLFSGKIIDPACGGAAFLAPVAHRIAENFGQIGKSSEEILSHIESHLYGIDSDPFLCRLSSEFLRMVLAPHIANAGRDPEFNILQGDGLSLLDESQSSFSLVLSNPPYRKMTKPEAKLFNSTYGSVIEGQPNLYTLFMRRATQLLASSGTAVLLTPMSFLSGRSFSKLREMLIAEGNVEQLDLIHNRSGVFMRAEQDAVVTVWRKVSKVDALASVYSLSFGASCPKIGSLELSKPGAPWLVPRRKEDAELLPLLADRKFTLEYYGYRAKTGAIVVHRDKRNRYSSEKTAENPGCLVPLIWARDIGHDGSFNLRLGPQCNDRFVDVEKPNAAALIKKPAVAMQRVTSSDQKRRLNCAAIPPDLHAQYGGVSGENHVCFLESSSSTPDLTPELLAQILRTNILDRLFRCISGATNVSAYELYQLPLPEIGTVREALSRGIPIEGAVRLGFGLDVDTPQNTMQEPPRKGHHATRAAIPIRELDRV